jgi:adenine deaminase
MDVGKMAKDSKITRREFNSGAAAAVAIATTVSQARAQTSQPFDLVIRNGRVMDPETNFDRVANVGVKDERIIAITSEAISGGREIDATGHIVAPGFIDTHYHWPRPMGNKIALRDGRTTVMDLEMGTLGTLVNDWYAQR